MDKATAAAACIALTVAYVGVLYLHPTARRSSRDDPVVIRARVSVILLCTVVSCAGTGLQLSQDDHENNNNNNSSSSNNSSGWVSTASWLKTLRIIPVPGVLEILRTTVLPTLIFFAGPLVDKVWLSQGYKWIWHDVAVAGTSWIGWRNYIVGPVTEELVFRACVVSVELHAGVSMGTLVFLTPLYFGVAHLHHAFEAYVKDPEQWKLALAMSTLQLCFTTVFGWYATFLYLRTGTIVSPIVAHALCNAIGLPRLRGTGGGQQWRTWVHRMALIAGPIVFATVVFPLTASSRSILQ
ncbi:hypothetical protein V1514DRAFT_338777 [Lipomyces japonicus]|uniref:uncharacterized protein n=1 Tax=Lipomyces japonicus TaxID=56871 RepID=UPI0034CDAA52